MNEEYYLKIEFLNGDIEQYCLTEDNDNFKTECGFIKFERIVKDYQGEEKIKSMMIPLSSIKSIEFTEVK